MTTIYLVILLCSTLSGVVCFFAGVVRTENKLIKYISRKFTKYSSPEAEEVITEIVWDISNGKYLKD